jgi:hypothetical protein
MAAIADGIIPEKMALRLNWVAVGKILKKISSSMILNNPDNSAAIVFHWSNLRLSISIKKRGLPC